MLRLLFFGLALTARIVIGDDDDNDFGSDDDLGDLVGCDVCEDNLYDGSCGGFQTETDKWGGYQCRCLVPT